MSGRGTKARIRGGPSRGEEASYGWTRISCKFYAPRNPEQKMGESGKRGLEDRSGVLAAFNRCLIYTYLPHAEIL